MEFLVVRRDNAMEIDPLDIQTVVLTPIAPALRFASIVGFLGGIVVAAISIGLEYWKNKQWPERRLTLKYSLAYVALICFYAAALNAIQLSMNPAMSIKDMNTDSLSNVAMICLILCVLRW